MRVGALVTELRSGTLTRLVPAGAAVIWTILNQGAHDCLEEFFGTTCLLFNCIQCGNRNLPLLQLFLLNFKFSDFFPTLVFLILD